MKRLTRNQTKINEAPGNVKWEYTDARGVRQKGIYLNSSERQGSDVTYYFKNLKTGNTDVVSGSRLKTMKRIYESHPTLRKLVRELLDEMENELDEATFTGNVDGYNIPGAFKKTDGRDEDNEPDSEHTERLNKSTGYTKVNEDKSWKRYLDPYTWFKDKKTTFKYRYKNVDIGIVYKLVDLTKKRGDAIENIGSNAWGVTEESAKYNQSVWQYLNGDLYYGNPAVKSEYDTIIPKLYKSSNTNESVLSENRWAKLRSDESKTPKQKIGLGIREIKTQLTEIENFLKWYNKIKLENDIAPSDYWKRTNKNLAKIRERVNNITSLIRDLNR